jgi:hypothetical protein
VIDVNPLKENNILYLSVLKDEIDFSPDYQREGDIWSTSKKQLFIDSLINNLDIPKLYFHEVAKSAQYPYRYAVVDGKQRLEALFEFLNDKFSISEDFEDFSGERRDIKGKKYSEFLQVSIRFKTLFDATQLPIFVIKTEDKELIDEMFYRLNEAAPLNAAEKRNSFRGPYPAIVRNLASHNFFQSKVPFTARRYRHHDIIGKLLLLSHSAKIVDTKRIHLDSFARSMVDFSNPPASTIEADVRVALDYFDSTFINSDKLLKSSAIIPLLYLAFKNLEQTNEIGRFTRNRIDDFEQARIQNRLKARDNEGDDTVDYTWLEYDRLIQSPNDSSSIEFRKKILLDFLKS